MLHLIPEKTGHALSRDQSMKAGLNERGDEPEFMLQHDFWVHHLSSLRSVLDSGCSDSGPAESSANSWGGIWGLRLHPIKQSWFPFVWESRSKPLWGISRHAVFDSGKSTTAAHPRACSFCKHHVDIRQGLELVLVTINTMFPGFRNSWFDNICKTVLHVPVTHDLSGQALTRGLCVPLAAF